MKAVCFVFLVSLFLRACVIELTRQFLKDARHGSHSELVLPLPHPGTTTFWAANLPHCTLDAGKAILDSLESQLHPVFGAICPSLTLYLVIW